MKRSPVLLIDAAINFALGLLLIVFSPEMVRGLGVPEVAHAFYPNILGGVLTGIGIALVVEYFRGPDGIVGLGLGGAVTINMCGGLVLAVQLVCGGLDIPPRGQIFLWALVVILVGISGVELLVHMGRKRARADA